MWFWLQRFSAIVSGTENLLTQCVECVCVCVCVCVCSQGTVLTPTMDHAMSIQPTSMMGPLTQQLSHLSLGSTGTVSTNHARFLHFLLRHIDTHTHKMNQAKKEKSPNRPEIHKVNCSCQILHILCVSSLPSLQYIPANSTMQGTYIPQYTPVPPSSVQEVRS